MLLHQVQEYDALHHGVRKQSRGRKETHATYCRQENVNDYILKNRQYVPRIHIEVVNDLPNGKVIAAVCCTVPGDETSATTINF